MSDHTRNKPKKSYTLKTDNERFLERLAAHRELSRSRLLDEVIEFYRERYDPNYRSHKRVAAPRYDPRT